MIVTAVSAIIIGSLIMFSSRAFSTPRRGNKAVTRSGTEPAVGRIRHDLRTFASLTLTGESPAKTGPTARRKNCPSIALKASPWTARPSAARSRTSWKRTRSTAHFRNSTRWASSRPWRNRRVLKEGVKSFKVTLLTAEGKRHYFQPGRGPTCR